MNLFSNTLRLFTAIAIIGIIAAFSSANAQYCTPSYYNSGYYMGIEYVQVADMENSSGWEYSPGYKYFNTKVATMKPTEEVSFYVGFGYTYEMELAIYIDWNADGKFDPKTELAFGTYGDYSWEGYSGKFTVPDDAKIGTTRMRVMTEYSYMYGSYPDDPCGTSYYYGEAEDYVVNIVPNAPDASITALNTPASPWRVGSHPINVTLKSNNKAPLKNVFIDWYVNNVFQGTHFWQGTLNENQTANVALGNATLDYPAGTSNFTPFNLRFVTRNPNGFDEDANPGNDAYSRNITPILNDAGVVGFFGPPEGFGPGVTPVRVRVRNYTPKPITSITIYWKIDNVDQTPVTLTGINIPRDETRDLNIGTYNFYAKTPLGPFTVECYSSNPNGVQDEDVSNDKYNGGIGPSLAAGTYTIGGSNAHFASPSEAASYINSSGIFGEGAVIFNVNPGTYNGYVILNSPLPRKNPISFIGNSQFPSDIVFTAPSTAQNNFIVLLDGLDKIRFSNLTIRNNNNNTSNAGILIDARRTNGLYLDKVMFEGVLNSPRNNENYSLVKLLNCTDVEISNSNFMNGSIAFNSLVNMQILPFIKVHHSDFYNFSWMGINNQVPGMYPIGHIEFSNNRFISNSGLAPTSGIRSLNSTSILNNQISGIVGTGSATDAAIYMLHSSQNPANKAIVESNLINNCTNINGIFVDGAATFINKNYVNITQTANYGLSALRVNNSVGAIGNNQFIGKEMSGIRISNSPNLETYYNTIVNESNLHSNAVLTSAGKLWRNIFFNNGIGKTYQVTGSVNSNQNVFFTKGSVVIDDNGANYGSLANWQAKGNDLNSEFAEIEFESTNEPKIKYYNSALLEGSALYNGQSQDLATIEHSDYYGTHRKSFFVGSHELELDIIIERQTDGFADCVGSTTNYLTVSASINYNAPMTYQWELDGKAIGGETEPILYFRNLRHAQAGIYRCLVGGPGATDPVYSREVSVYVTRPTDITREPESQKVPVGSHVVLSFDAHVNGKNIETAIVNDEVTVRWYKYVDEANDIPLVDNNWISGSKSNYLTFNSFRQADQGDYYAIIDGNCGSVKSKIVSVSEEIIDLTITQQPIDINDCSGKDIMLTVSAETQSSKPILYQWFKNGIALSDNMPKMEGTNSRHLIIYSSTSDDEGSYYAQVSLDGTEISLNSNTVLVNITNSPVIKVQPQSATVQQGKQLLLDVIAEGDDLNYTWYKDGESLFTSEDPVFVVDPVTPDDEGDYYVEVWNDCGKVASNVARVTITTGTTSVFEVFSGGYSLTTAVPNPVSSVSSISFNVPAESLVKISLSDMTGAFNSIISENTYSTGKHSVNLDIRSMNLSSGTYYCTLESNGVFLVQKIIVVR